MNSIATLAMNLAQVETTTQNTAPAFLQFIPIILIVVVFYFLIIRPQSQKAKEHQKLIESVKSGDKVVIGGIHGVVSNVKDGIAVVRIAEGVKIEVDKSSITTVSKGSESDSK